ncbi:MAG: hypothetical protein KAS73_14450 [Candidatus Sabulitectum sp.]|nr:hypothetical protein [Candidatus Sabulitectum sp.]
MKDLSHESRGWVKGLSMWPNLIPGDVLKAESIPVAELKTGMIAVFLKADEELELLVVHRVLSVHGTDKEVIVESGGDRSGPDEAAWHFHPSDRVKRVSAVLRRGSYRNIGSMLIPLLFSPSLVVRVHCGIVRRLFW